MRRVEAMQCNAPLPAPRKRLPVVPGRGRNAASRSPAFTAVMGRFVDEVAQAAP